MRKALPVLFAALAFADVVTLGVAGCGEEGGSPVGTDASANPPGPDSAALVDAHSPLEDGGTQTDGGGTSTEAGFVRAAVPCGSRGYPRPSKVAGETTLIDFGVARTLERVRRSNDRILTLDGDQRWILWDADTLEQIASGGAIGDGVDLANDRVFVRKTSNEADLLDARTGQVISTLTASSIGEASLSSDGSYLWSATATRLAAWSLTGERLLDRAGNYGAASVMIRTRPGKIHVAKGPAGNVVETIPIGSALNGGTASLHSFDGAFGRLFEDGARFLTTESTAVDGGTQTRVRIYSSDSGGIVEDKNFFRVTNFAGTGDFYWGDFGGHTEVYRLGGGVQPVVKVTSRTGGEPIGGALFFQRENAVDVVRFTSSGPVLDSVESDALQNSRFSVAAADFSGRWVYSNLSGATIRGGSSTNPEEIGWIGCGSPFTLAASKPGTVVITTAAGNVLVYDVSQDPPVFRGDLNFVATRAMLSEDGRLLATASAGTGRGPWEDNKANDRSLRIIELPSGKVLHTLPSTRSFPTLAEFELAREGTKVARVTREPGDAGQFLYRRFVTDLSGQNETFRDQVKGSQFDGQFLARAPALTLSPSGRRVGAPVGDWRESGATTSLYEGNRLLGTVPGFVVFWLDEDNVVAQAREGRAKAYRVDGTLVRELAGSPGMYPASSFAVIDPMTFFARGETFDVTTGVVSGIPSYSTVTSTKLVWTNKWYLYVKPR